MITTNSFFKSKIENELYKIADAHTLVERNTEQILDKFAAEDMEKYLIDTEAQFLIQTAEWRDGEGYVLTISWIESGILHMLGWDCIYNNEFSYESGI